MIPFLAAIAGITALVAALVTFLVKWRAPKLGLVDTPNGRSSHRQPTPTGGGLGIVVASSLAGLLFVGFLEPAVGITAITAGVLLAFIGFWDDRSGIAAKWRLAAQVLLSGLVIGILPLEPLSAALGLNVPEPALLTLLVLAVALFINLFNFMDGIDGLAAGEAIFLMAGAALLVLLRLPDEAGHPFLLWMVALCGAVLGFLPFNLPKARIFMGDTGSTYLGLMIGFFSLASIAFNWLTPWQWLILTGLFLADSLTTLVRRAIAREPLFRAHRSHAYQRLARRWQSHGRVSALYMAINLALLLPLAWAAGTWPAAGPWLALAALAGLAGLAVLAGAGSADQADKERA